MTGERKYVNLGPRSALGAKVRRIQRLLRTAIPEWCHDTQKTMATTNPTSTTTRRNTAESMTCTS